MLKRAIDWIRGEAAKIGKAIAPVLKTIISAAAIRASVVMVDELALLATSVDPAAEVWNTRLDAIVSVVPMPEAVKAEILSLANDALVSIRTLKNPTLVNSLKRGLAAEITNIITGKVHDINTILADIDSLWTAQVHIEESSAPVAA